MRVKNLALCFVLFFCFSVQAEASHTGTVSGRVISQDKHPVDFASVFLRGTSIAVYTDEKGLFFIGGVTPGNYTLVASRVGHEEAALSVRVTTNGTVKLPDIVLKDVGQVDEVLVIGKSDARKVKELSYSVATIDLQKLRNSAKDLNQLVNMSTGVRIREEGGLGSGYSFNLNGFSGKQVKFFLDGVPMDNFGSSFGMNSLSPNMVSRVEIYKGVLPVSLGADALGGAVNIVSRRDANYLDASYSIGSFNTHKASANAAYTDIKTGLTTRINVFFNYSDNDYKVFVPVIDLETGKKGENQWVRRFHDAYRAAGLKFEAGWTNVRFADNLLFGIVLSGDDKEIQNGVTMEKVFGGITRNSQSLIPSVRYQKKDFLLKGLDINVYGAYNANRDHYTDTTAYIYNWHGDRIPRESSTSAEKFRSQKTEVKKEWLAVGNAAYRLSATQRISLNYVFTHYDREISDKEVPDKKEYQIPQNFAKHITGLGWNANYTRWSATLFAKLYRMKGISYEYVDQYTESERLEEFTTRHSRVGYGASTSYFVLPCLQGKVSYEHTYRLPEGVEMFGDGIFNLRNPSLKPESSDNYNVSLHYNGYFKKEHYLNAELGAVFRNTRDFIQKELKDPSTTYVNLDKVKTVGVEAGLNYEWNDLLHAGANVTYQNIVDNAPYYYDTGGYVSTGKKENFNYKDRLPNIPYLFGNVSVGMRFRNVIADKSELTIDYELNYVHDYFLSWPALGTKDTKALIPEQLSHNVSLGYSLHNGRYNVTLECANIANAKLYDNYMLQKPGRAFNLKLRYFIGK